MGTKVRARAHRRPERRKAYDGIYGKKNPRFEKQPVVEDHKVNEEFEKEYEAFIKKMKAEQE